MSTAQHERDNDSSFVAVAIPATPFLLIIAVIAVVNVNGTATSVMTSHRVGLVPSWQQHDDQRDGDSLFVVVAVSAISPLLIIVAVVAVINVVPVALSPSLACHCSSPACTPYVARFLQDGHAKLQP
jgi:uncharacterized protein YqhQ